MTAAHTAAATIVHAYSHTTTAAKTYYAAQAMTTTIDAATVASTQAEQTRAVTTLQQLNGSEHSAVVLRILKCQRVDQLYKVRLLWWLCVMLGKLSSKLLISLYSQGLT